MTPEQFTAWKKEKYIVPFPDDTARALAGYIGRPDDAKQIEDALYWIMAAAENEYNQDYFRALFAAVTDAVELAAPEIPF